MISHRRLLDAACSWTCVLVFLMGITSARAATPPPQSNFSIVNAGVQSEEDGPIVPPDYGFFPGQYVYFTFDVSGYKVKGNEYNGPQQMSLAYKVQLLDAKNVPLVEEQTGEIAQEIGPEDKGWLPKRRFSALLPPLIGAGTYHVHLIVRDLFAKSEAAADFPFAIGGKKVENTTTIQIQNFRFLRSDQDGPALEVPAFRPGDTVWARFDMTGFKIGTGNAVTLSYGVSVLRPDGKALFTQEHAAEEKRAPSFYPPQFVPGVLSVSTTPDLLRGEYTMIVSAVDETGKASTKISQKFRIE